MEGEQVVMVDSPPAEPTPASSEAAPVSYHSSPQRSPHRSPHRSPNRSPYRSRSPHRRRQHEEIQNEILRGAAWAPPWTAHELHSREVYARSKTPSPPCDKFRRDVAYDEINDNVVKKREEDAKKSHKHARHKHKHEGLVMQRAREFERKSRQECERYSKQVSEFKGRMNKREADSRPLFRNRAEQILALGLNKGSPSRPGSPRH